MALLCARNSSLSPCGASTRPPPLLVRRTIFQHQGSFFCRSEHRNVSTSAGTPEGGERFRPELRNTLRHGSAARSGPALRLSSAKRAQMCVETTESYCGNTFELFLLLSSPSLTDSLTQVSLLASSAHISPLYSLIALFTRSLIQNYSRSLAAIRQNTC